MDIIYFIYLVNTKRKVLEEISRTVGNCAEVDFRFTATKSKGSSFSLKDVEKRQWKSSSVCKIINS